MQPKPWKVISSKVQESFPIFDIRTDQARSPRTNRTHDFYILDSADWVNVIPLPPSDEVVLIRQYRHGIRDLTLEIPGGIVEMNDSPEEAARRELRDPALRRLCRPSETRGVRPQDQTIRPEYAGRQTGLRAVLPGPQGMAGCRGEADRTDARRRGNGFFNDLGAL